MTKTFFVAAALMLCVNAFSQVNGSARKYEMLLKQSDMKETLSYIADDNTKGRESGSDGNRIVEQFIVKKFKAMGLKPFHWSYTQSVPYEDSIVLRNVVGLLPASKPSDEYIVVGAHYDHIGQLAGRIYNGADDNASGVTAMLSLADAFSRMKADGAGPSKNIIFVAYDGKELSMSGSKHFVKELGIPAKKVICALNIDMLGTDLVPVGKNREYMIVLGEDSLPDEYRGYLSYLCNRTLYRMDLDLSFYGSRNFTKMIYETGDHYSFAKAGIPSVLFTSAFHKHTYRPTDDVDIIDFQLLRKRTAVIYNFINRLCSF